MKPQEFYIIRKKIGLSRKKLGLKLGRSGLMILCYEKGKYPIPKAIELCMKYFDIYCEAGK